jgi:hypothetical protein
MRIGAIGERVVAPFEKGMTKIGGRARGVKNRLSHAFLTALAEDFEQYGVEAIKICRVERPNEYLRVIAHLMPKELEVTVGPLQEVSDQELEKLIEHARTRIIDITPSAGGGEESHANGRPAPLLSALRQTT